MRGVADRAGYRNPARFGHELDASGDVDGIAEYGLGLVDDDLAQMQPDAEHQPLPLVERIVEEGHPLLDVDRGRHCSHRRAEFGEDGVGYDVDDPAAHGFDGSLPHLDAHRLEAVDRAVLGTFHQAHEAGQVGMKDGGQPAAVGGRRRSGR